MTKNQINKFRMYGAVDLVLGNHSALFSGLADLVTVHQRLKDGMQSISDLRQVQEVDNSGLTQSKAELHAQLFNRILQFSAALMAYSTSVKDTNLKTKANYSKTLLTRSSDPVLFDIGVLLLGLATPLKAELAVYFLGDADYTDMETLLADFKVAIPQKRVATNLSKVSTENIKDQFSSMDLLLKNELDILMAPLQFTQADFYNAYKNARIIVDYTGRGKTNGDETTPPPPVVPS